jgi:hypothetical protein
MPNFDAEIARRVVTDLGRTQNAIDGALKKLSVLTVDVLDAFGDARLSDATTQPALEGLADGFKMMVNGRKAFVSVHQELISMKVESNLKHVEIGCDPGPICPWDIKAPELRVVA